MAVEARFMVNEKTERIAVEDACAVRVKLEAAYNDGVGNEDWSKWTPSGEIEMEISNPPAADFFKTGEVYRVVFTRVRE